MEIESFIAGSLASLLGVFATILATNKIEKIKAKSESAKYRNMLYLELRDLCEECFDSLDDLYSLYAKAYMYERTNEKHYLDNYQTPKSLNLIVLKDTIDKCFLDLTKEQRGALRSLLSLVEQVEVSFSKLAEKTYENHRNITPNDVYRLLSSFGVIYQLALALSNEKERYAGIKKSPSELMDDTLMVKSFSLEFIALSNRANVA
ncbi:hypothetical protein CGJ07_21125 [Vibrio parahaemolyticus]|uniref:hypothetical protein n=1 Tax=Vibrio parahaemolyticus TaxID=670 RepID=UPI0011241C43|nr:hypothetical protein [Vibrio parahaemolyticus]TOG17959.1 hypothetical protein CGJ07_21125 [Vibrio parahaemolyticus]